MTVPVDPSVTHALSPLPDQGDGIFHLSAYGSVARVISRAGAEGRLVLIGEGQHSGHAVKFHPVPVIKLGERWYELLRDGVREALLGLHRLGAHFPDETVDDLDGMRRDLLLPTPGDEQYRWWYMVTHVAGAQSGNRQGDVTVTQGARHYPGTMFEWDEPTFTPGLSIDDTDAPQALKDAVRRA
ncbi:hypothetical protein [Deinococcus ficus]|uniref:Uncharacterized protein n=1 Tax=Deinococcus ficus TaxID=317577 RepID=A0A221T386_9DEIO|nr:hypothetical protein [Deinococcus ficus]ASN83320.1 hypothetical protein DFI_19170 [Deinococcus ficus]